MMNTMRGLLPKTAPDDDPPDSEPFPREVWLGNPAF
jgi:hypothetical protein